MSITIRNRAVIEVYNRGFTSGAVSRLNLSSVDVDQNTISVVDKAGEEKIAPIDRHVIQSIEVYLEVRTDMVKKNYSVRSNALFVNQRGGRLSASSICEIVRKEKASRGALKLLSPDALHKHPCSAPVSQQKVDIEAVLMNYLPSKAPGVSYWQDRQTLSILGHWATEMVRMGTAALKKHVCERKEPRPLEPAEYLTIAGADHLWGGYEGELASKVASFFAADLGQNRD